MRPESLAKATLLYHNIIVITFNVRHNPSKGQKSALTDGRPSVLISNTSLENIPWRACQLERPKGGEANIHRQRSREERSWSG